LKFVENNIKNLLMHDLGGTIVIEFMSLLLKQQAFNVISKDEIDSFIEKILRKIMTDREGRELSPTPPIPEEPISHHSKMNDNNGDEDDLDIIDNSFKIIESKKLQNDNKDNNEPQSNSNKNTSLANVDISNMNDQTAQNILALKQYEIDNEKKKTRSDIECSIHYQIIRT